MKIFVIADPETALAFALAGMDGRSVEGEADVASMLRQIDREKYGLVLITELLAEKNRECLERLLLEPGGPLILEIPGVSGPMKIRGHTTDRIVSLLRR